MRGEEEDSKSVEVLHISVQLFIAVTLFMKKDEMSGGDKMIKDKMSGRRGGGGGVEKLPKHRIEQDGRSQHHPQG